MFFHGKYIRSLLFVSFATPLTRRVDLIRCFFLVLSVWPSWDQRMLNPKTNEEKEKKRWKMVSHSLLCNNAWWRGFLFGFRHNARHDVSAPNKGGAKARRFSTTKYPQYSTIPNEYRPRRLEGQGVLFNAEVTSTPTRAHRAGLAEADSSNKFQALSSA